MFEITEVVPSPATGFGALDGFEAVCSCGLVMRSSMRTTVLLDVQAHTVWHNNRLSRGTPGPAVAPLQPGEIGDGHGA